MSSSSPPSWAFFLVPHTLSHFSPCMFLFLLVSPDTTLNPPSGACLCTQMRVLVHTCMRASAVCMCAVRTGGRGAVNLLSGLIHLRQGQRFCLASHLCIWAQGESESAQMGRGAAVSPSGVRLLLLLCDFKEHKWIFLGVQDCVYIVQDNGSCVCVHVKVCMRLPILTFVCVKQF